jgi:hypothetical protein
MKQITQKSKKIKNKAGQTVKNILNYKRSIALITDYLTGEEFPVIVYSLRSSKKTHLPEAKILLPSLRKKSDNIDYIESTVLLRDLNGGWVKNVSTDFSKKSRDIVGIHSMIEDVELMPLDIVIIAQVEDMLYSHGTLRQSNLSKAVS